MIDEVMFEIRELTGQEYRNAYAGKKAEAEPTDRDRPCRPTSPTPTRRAGDRAPSSSAPRRPEPASRRQSPAGRDGPLVDSAALMSRTITITLPDGSAREYPAGTTAGDVAASIGTRLAKAAVAARRSTATRSTSAVRSPTATAVADRHRRHRRRPPRAAPLDGPRDGPGRHPAVPGRQVLDRPGHRERLLLRLRAARRGARSARTTSPRSRRGCARSSRADQPFVRAEVHAPTRRSTLFADQPYKVEIIERVRDAGDGADDARRRRGRPAARRSACTATRPSSSTCAGARTCRRPGASATSSCRRSPAPTGGATRRARCCSASTARRGSPTAALEAHLAPAGRGREARPPQAGRRARPAQLPERARRRPRRVAPEGRHRPQADGGLQPAAPRATAATSSSSRRTSPRRSCSRPAATSTGTPTACTRRWRWTTARTT